MKTFTKKVIVTALLAGMTTALFAGCSSAETDDTTFTIWAGGSDNVKVQLEQQVALFNETNDTYTAKLEFITSGTGAQGVNDRLIAAYKAGETDTSYDLIEIADGDLSSFVAQGIDDMFLEIDTDKLTNYEALNYQASEYTEFIVPYRGTTVLLAYNSETVTDVPTTPEELYDWIKANPGRFAYNTPNSGGAGGSFAITTVYNQMDESLMQSSDEANKELWDAGFTIMEELHPYMYQSSGKVVYPNKNQGAMDLLANKEIDMTPVWADMFITQKNEGTMPECMQVTQLDPAFTGNLVGFSIPSIGSNSEGALAFIDFMLSTAAQNIALSSMAALPVVDFDTLDPDAVAAISTLDVSEFRGYSIGDLASELYDLWDETIATLG